jgi:hypothetical protein
MSSLKFLLSKFDESIQHPFVGDIDFPIGGLFIVDLPDGSQITDPTDYTDLKSKKSAAILAMYPDFPNIVYNELHNAFAINTSAPGHRALLGDYEWILTALDVDNGRVTTVTSALAGTAIELVPLWAVFQLNFTTGDANQIDAYYVEADPSDITVEISVDGGITYDTATSNVALTPTVPGASMILRFTNSSVNNIYLAYYAVVYRT